MTADGFSPQEMTVHVGGTINFANKDTVPRWPASNLHPTHELYPEFDPTQAIEPGNFWIFKATRIGTWKYHDHLYPHRRGTIIVVPEDSEQQIVSNDTPTPQQAPLTTQPTTETQSLLHRIVATIQNLFAIIQQRFSQQYDSASQIAGTTDIRALPEKEQYNYLQQLAEQAGVDSAWHAVKTAYTNEAGASRGGRAHDAAHFVGSLIYKDKGIDGLTICDASFAFGCFHGFTEAAFVENLTPLVPVAAACETIGPQMSGPWASCIHGIGHGVATFFNASDLTAALAECDKLEAASPYCHDGVLMEFSLSAPDSFYQQENPLFPCTKLSPRYQQACARNQPQVMQRRFHMDLPAIASACLTAPAAITDPCIDAIGFAIAHESQGNPHAILARCGQLPSLLTHAKCVTAGAGELVFQNFPNWQAAAPTACNMLPPDFQTPCHARVWSTAQNYQRS